MRHFFLFLLLIILILQPKLNAQDTTFKNGYALKGVDTIFCKVKFCKDCAPYHKHSVTLLIENDEITFTAGNPITGYGVFDNGNEYHYGALEIEIDIPLGNQFRSQTIFLKKIVAGVIDFYEHSYNITSSKRTTINGVQQRGAETSRQEYIKYYIAKTDSAAPGLSTPLLLPSFRKKDLEPYLSDHVNLFSKIEKKLSLKELIAALKEYNTWYLEKKK